MSGKYKKPNGKQSPSHRNRQWTAVPWPETQNLKVINYKVTEYTCKQLQTKSHMLSDYLTPFRDYLKSSGRNMQEDMRV